MLNSKQRAELRAQSNDLDTTLMVGKGGVTEAVIAEAENQLTARELVKGKVLEGALMSPREVSDAICEATGAEGVACVGSKFVIYRFSEKKQAERNMTGRAKRKGIAWSIIGNFPEKAKLDEIAKFSNYTITPMILNADGTLTKEEVKEPPKPKRRFR